MADVAMTDDGIAFDGTTPDRVPLGGSSADEVAGRFEAMLP